MKAAIRTFKDGNHLPRIMMLSGFALIVACSNNSDGINFKRPSENVTEAFANNQVVNDGNAGQNLAPVAVTSDKIKFASREFGVDGSPRVTKSRRVKKGGGYYKVGKPYKIRGKRYVPRENPNYKKVGLASWYGPNFHGRLTANGEIYDQFSLSAAHPTLPLPSYAKVTNLENGASVTVRVNDRGPYAHNRIIDLSSRAAQLLGYTKQGVAKVRVEYVGKARLDGLDEKFLVASYNPGTLNPRSIPANPGGPVLVADANSQSNRVTLQAYDQTAFAPPLPEFRPVTSDGYPVDISSLNAPRPSALINGFVGSDSKNSSAQEILKQFSRLSRIDLPQNGMAEIRQMRVGSFTNRYDAKDVESMLLKWGPASVIHRAAGHYSVHLTVLDGDVPEVIKALRAADIQTIEFPKLDDSEL
ncbi:MAG: septal ring lytic transglycosylase RlpA family protein [Pseudomonadota bacterium]